MTKQSGRSSACRNRAETINFVAVSCSRFNIPAHFSPKIKFWPHFGQFLPDFDQSRSSQTFKISARPAAWTHSTEHLTYSNSNMPARMSIVRRYARLSASLAITLDHRMNHILLRRWPVCGMALAVSCPVSGNKTGRCLGCFQTLSSAEMLTDTASMLLTLR